MKKLAIVIILLIVVAVLSLSVIAQDDDTLESNKELVRQLVHDVKNRNNPAAAAEIFAENFVHHWTIPGIDIPEGLAGAGMIGEIFGQAFPEITVEIEILFAGGDYVLERSSVTAFHGGDFLGYPATNMNVTWTENHVYRIENGRIVEHIPETNFLGVLDQIGALASSEATQAKINLAHSYVACINAGDIPCLLDILSPDMTSITPLFLGIAEGRDTFLAVISPIFEAFPDGVSIEILDTIVDVERGTVLTRHFVSATHNGPLLGIPATGTNVVWTEWDAFNFITDDDGRLWINNITAEANFLGILIQVGALGAPPADE